MRILVVEDNLTLAEGLCTVLRGDGYAVDTVHDGVSAEAVLRTQSYDLAVLDLNLPEMDGLELLRTLRARQASTAVIVLTARGALEDRVRGLDLGADDYMTKPFDVSELEARIRALLRRQAGLRGARVSFGPVVLDLNTRTASSEGRPLDIPARELSVLETLMLKSGKVVAKEAIIQSLSAFDDDLSSNAVEQYASRLRKRLAPFGLTVRTARGLGYYLDKVGANG